MPVWRPRPIRGQDRGSSASFGHRTETGCGTIRPGMHRGLSLPIRFSGRWRVDDRQYGGSQRGRRGDEGRYQWQRVDRTQRTVKRQIAPFAAEPVPLQSDRLTRRYRPKREGVNLFEKVVASHQARFLSISVLRCERSLLTASRMRVLTVPSGAPVLMAISSWVSPLK